MVTKKQLISMGVDNLATILMTVYESNYIFQKQLNLLVESMSSDQDKNLILVMKEVRALVKLQEPKSSNRSAKVTQRIHHARCMIMETIFPIDPAQAIASMLTLLSVQHKVYPRKNIGPAEICTKKMDHVFKIAWKDFLYLYTFVPQSISIVVDLIYQQCLNPNFLLTTDTVNVCKDILGKDGFALLYEKLEPLKLYKSRDDRWDRGLSVKKNARDVLLFVADLQKDPVAYEKIRMYFDIYPDYYNTLDMADRYAQYGDGHAVLRILDSYRCNRYGQPYFQELQLRGKAYQSLGEHDKAVQMQQDLIVARELQQ